MTALRPRRWTLRTKLVASVLLVFFLVSSVVGALTVWRLHQTLVGQIDQQLATSYRSMQRDDGAAQVGGGAPLGGSSLQVDVVAATGQPIQVYDPRGDTYLSASVFTPDGRTPLTDQQLRRLLTSGLGAAPTTVEIEGLGEYRTVSMRRSLDVRDRNTGRRAHIEAVSIVGLPVAPMRTTVARTAFWTALLTFSALIVMAGATAYVVRRGLEPLRRVAATATKVSTLELSKGEVDIVERVQPRDTDPGTEAGRVGYALNKLLDHISAALTARQNSEMQVRQFVADASHELRTPLASIRGYAELSKREKDPVPAGVQHALTRIESESGRMTALVEDLLLLARLDSGRPLERSPVDLSMLVVETTSDARVAGPDHRWQIDLPEEAVEVVGDEARLRQVLINLLANARRHTPPGTTVTAGARVVGDRAVVTVVDDGPGIPAELLPRVFERFIRGDSARTRTEGSTGLGLSIVHAVATSHGGSVAVRSVPGRTEFTVSLPLVPPPTVQDVTP